MIANFGTLQDLVKVFSSEQVCIEHLESLRWRGNVVSPFDPSSKVYNCSGNKYKCHNTNRYFNVRTGTLFDNTKLPLQKCHTEWVDDRFGRKVIIAGYDYRKPIERCEDLPVAQVIGLITLVGIVLIGGLGYTLSNRK